VGFAVALVHPYLHEARNKNRLKFRESLALGYLSAALKNARIAYTSINAELQALNSGDVTARLIDNGDVQLIGLSCKSQRAYRAAREIAHAVKARRPEIHITIGGVLATAADKELLGDCSAVDSVVRGEGESAIVELAERIRDDKPLEEMKGLTFRSGRDVIRNGARPRISNLDEIAFPLRDDLEYVMRTNGSTEASAYIVASRGCYAACTFCSIHQIYGNRLVVRRSPRNLISEIKDVIAQYGIRRFAFVDDIFLIPSRIGERWVSEFCDLVVESKLDINFYAEMRADTVTQHMLSKMSSAGLHRVFVGFEAGVDSVLSRWDKGTTVSDNDLAIAELKRSNFKSHQINMGYIMFDPEMTYDELVRQYAWVKQTGLAKVQHLQNKMNVYWGTPHYDRMVQQGRVDNAPFGDRWLYEFDDSKVAFVERSLRRFHTRFEESASEELLNAKESFRTLVKVHEDVSQTGLPHWSIDCLAQAHRRLEGLERALYYSIFEECFIYLDRGGPVGDVNSDVFLEQLWQWLTPSMQQLQRESRFLTHALLEIRGMASASEMHSRNAIGRLNPEDNVTTLSLILVEGTTIAYSAQCGFHGSDRYDHSCRITVQERGRIAVLEEGPLVARYRSTVSYRRVT